VVVGVVVPIEHGQNRTTNRGARADSRPTALSNGSVLAHESPIGETSAYPRFETARHERHSAIAFDHSKDFDDTAVP
jgi:hypothetical protein